MSTQTLNEIVTQYLDNAGYKTLESAELYQEAIRQLFVRRPKVTMIDNQRIEFDMNVLRDELKRVNVFVDQERAKQAAAQGQGNSYSRTYDLSNLRD